MTMTIATDEDDDNDDVNDNLYLILYYTHAYFISYVYGIEITWEGSPRLRSQWFRLVGKSVVFLDYLE